MRRGNKYFIWAQPERKTSFLINIWEVQIQYQPFQTTSKASASSTSEFTILCHHKGLQELANALN
jgi:hypothetical protein